MNKKVIFNGIEIWANDSDSSAQNMLGLVESVIDNLESDLDKTDENFNISININFAPGDSAKYSFSITNLLNNGMNGKVIKILEKSINSSWNNMSGSMKIDFQVENS